MVGLLSLQRALRQQQTAVAKRIAEGRSDGRTRRRLLRKERMNERMRLEREEHTKRRQMVKVCLTAYPSWAQWHASSSYIKLIHHLRSSSSGRSHPRATHPNEGATVSKSKLGLSVYSSLSLDPVQQHALLLQEALARQEQAAEPAQSERLALDLTERLRELRESRERRQQSLQLQV